ncbi:cyanophycin synthetase [Clostridium oryzae]|uniref:Cyanophycin synthetase n=1 Tax=Clostridium oryzae TaxID=1450648 RepID=A0A1V4IVF4_9CLOT|nr:cyanophycin synthetase [Clostridium oryzae]OPJ63397.1 cyanophycin synthetase [Clostridium oryzae]
MKILNTQVLRGRNIYAHKPCIRMELDLEGYGDIPSKDISGFNDMIVEILPVLKQHRCGIDEDQGFLKRLQEGTYLAHIFEHMIIAIQNVIGIDVAYGKARTIDEKDRYYIVFQFKYEKTALKCAELALDMINCAIRGSKFIDFDQRIKSIKSLLKAECIGPSTEAICIEAKKREIDVIELGDTGFIQLGTGKYGKLIENTICESTSAVAVDISCDKLATKYMLSRQNIPVAEGYKVNNTMELMDYAYTIGYPVVIKPQFGSKGKGIIINIKNDKELLEAYNKIIKEYKNILIEKYVEGNDYRLCVIDGEVKAAALRIPPFIVGDGNRTIKELIDVLNSDDRRGEDHERPLTKVTIDIGLLEKLKRSNYDLDTVIPRGEKIYLRDNANLSTGAIAKDCTNEVCEENRELCRRIYKIIGLNICGIDICCRDISKPLQGQGVILEVNAAPGIRMHHYPYEGEAQNVAAAIVDMMFKEGERSSMPIISITGTNGKTTTTRMIGHVMKTAGYKVGMTTTGGVYIDGKCVRNGDTTGYESSLSILLNREVDAAVLEIARGGLIRKGLAYNLADVGIITNVTGDHLGLDGVRDMKDLINVKSLIIEAVKKDGYAVLNGDDKATAELVKRVNCKTIIFSKDYDNEFIRKCSGEGNIAIYLKDDDIMIKRDSTSIKILNIKEVPITIGGKLTFNIENTMAAIAALIGVGVSINDIVKGVTSFYLDECDNCGRFNMFNLGDINVILDYGHNREGYNSVIAAIKKFKSKRLVGVIGVPGDRRDEDIIEIGDICSRGFDCLYVKEDEDKRGRKSGEVAELLVKGVKKEGKFDTRNNLRICLNEQKAMLEAINAARPGDTIVVFFEKYEPLLETIKAMKESMDSRVSMTV